ncbi:aspartate carbamoyltransferase [Candidatus Roizmanbacteria bacterium RIFCSPLOWO2_12_FULL_40_12]|nr:MAG: aspartate carbamoyltransferase [Candidatus Roizmanbacteria bacterium RIFCSPHIGHO2_12_41_18]OGK58494.1 MAG: aspartate carbamoyltransferase [Candidatus Roizmanbacteria bacterium RIFCSPLOWO2_02_FULL_40_13]OGK60895.1 MAG: aspartate carbamoyltransferase [Candidatus Roizmanbacteria bacterium RIFCSPLOWO2_12_FULL_40_12]
MFLSGKIAGDFRKKHILSISQFDQASIAKLFKKTDWILSRVKRKKDLDILKRSVATLLFFEPSSRTFGSFSSAIQRLGGKTIDVQNATQFSATAKGESLSDTIKTFEAYSDLIVIRHPQVGSALQAAEATTKALIINAGDGGDEHPTQTLLELYTINKHFKRLNNLVCVVSTDPLHSRTIKTFVRGLALYPNNTVYFFSPKKLHPDKLFKDELLKKGVIVKEISEVNEIPKNADIWYWNRLQKERLKGMNISQKELKKYVLTLDLLKKRGNKNMIIMNPLPRVEEIDKKVDSDPRTVYFEEMNNGLYVRMALVGLVLGKL